eukprot:symbB.v1.2.003689.t1/scaffold193.1/size400748/8
MGRVEADQGHSSCSQGACSSLVFLHVIEHWADRGNSNQYTSSATPKKNLVTSPSYSALPWDRMSSVLVRLNLPGFASPEPFRLGNAPASIAGLACAVLQEIGGFNQDELEAVRNHLDQVPLTLLGELCAGQLVELASDAELGVFLATAESPKGPPIIEVRPRHGAAGVSPLPQSPGPLGLQGMTYFESPTPSGTSLGGLAPLSATPEAQRSTRLSEDKELQEHLQLQQELQQKQRQLQQQQQLLQQQFEQHARDKQTLDAGTRTNGHHGHPPEAETVTASRETALPASSRWEQDMGR